LIQEDKEHPKTPRHAPSTDDDDGFEDDEHEEKFILRFLATNTTSEDRYLWVTDEGEVRCDGGHANIASRQSFFIQTLGALLNIMLKHPS